MWRFARWSSSLCAVVAFNALLVLLAVGTGWRASSARDTRAYVRPVQPALDGAGRARQDVLVILGGNLCVAARLVMGACTLGLFTVLELGWHSFVLGLSALTRTSPEIIPLIARYVWLEFSAFVLAAAAAEHLSFTVLRCLAAGETPRFTSVVVTLATALGMLVAAAIIEANVTRLVAVLAA